MEGNQFSLGRSLFEGTIPGTPQILQSDSSWGRIQSVETQTCLNLNEGVNYPIASECAQINDTTTEQAWHYSLSKELKFLDIEQDHSIESFYQCLYAFGDKDDNTGFVRIKECPGSSLIDGDMIENAHWEPIFNTANSLEYRLRSLNNDLCLGEEITKVKAGKAGKPGPARIRTTWALVDCEHAPWWQFLHLFETYKIDEKLCKVAGDPDSCIRYKNKNRKMPLGLITNELSADDVNFSRSGPEVDYLAENPDDEKDAEYYEKLYQQYLSMYAYYLDSDFDEYDYTGYTDT